jgi:hypothetical protein
LDECELLPSPLGTGRNARTNCTDRCVLSEERVANVVIECYQRAAAAESVDWCRAESACPILADCLGQRFPGEDPTGVGFIEVQVGIARNGIARNPAECSRGDDSADDDALGTRDPMDCAAVGVTDVTLFPIPGSRPIEIADRQRSCTDALSASFPTVEARAGAYQAKLKLIGPGPSLDALDAGLNDAGDASVEPAPGPVAACKILSSHPLGIAAGEMTRVNLSIPGDWATSSFLSDCETECFDSADNDGDGLPDCSDPACQAECSKCRLTRSEDGRLVPDCSEPTCPCFTPIDAGAVPPSDGPSRPVGAGDAGAMGGGDGVVAPSPLPTDAGDSGPVVTD